MFFGPASQRQDWQRLQMAIQGQGLAGDFFHVKCLLAAVQSVALTADKIHAIHDLANECKCAIQ